MVESALSILFRNRKRGIFWSSSSRRISCSCGTFFSSISQTTTAASTAGSAARMSWMNSTEPGQSTNVKFSPMKLVVATESFDAHAVVARFLAGVADRGSRIDGALALDRAGAREDGFEKSGLAALERAHQRDAPGTRGSCAVLCHFRLPS